jgi:hypothetical protein
MKEISQRLWDAIAAVAGMKHPTLAKILRRRGFGYGADRVDDLITALEEAKRLEEEKPHGA